METTHDGHLFSHRAAHRRAAWRTRLVDELLRYLVVTSLLWILVRPIGVIVALVWGLGIFRRYWRGRVEPRLHRRFLRDELRRCGHAGCAPPTGRPGRPGRERAAKPRPAELAESMGDDPRAASALDWARTALAELADTESPARPAGRGRVCVADLVEDVVDACEARAARDGITFRLETDAEGEIEADATRLKAALLDLVNESARALARGAHGPGRVRIEMGENLAGSEVWVRIVDDRVDATDGARGTWGSRPVPGLPGAVLETQAGPDGVERILTLKKRPHPTNPNPRARHADGAGDAA
jgi:hypothetical protein